MPTSEYPADKLFEVANGVSFGSTMGVVPQ